MLLKQEATLAWDINEPLQLSIQIKNAVNTDWSYIYSVFNISPVGYYILNCEPFLIQSETLKNGKHLFPSILFLFVSTFKEVERFHAPLLV